MGAQPLADGTHLQAFEVLVGGEDWGSRLSVGDITIDATGATVMLDWTASSPVISGEGVYVGAGLIAEGRNDYGSVDVRGKVVFIIPSVPAEWKEDMTLGLLDRTKIQVALGRGASAVVMLKPGSTDAPGPVRVMALTDGSTPAPRAAVTLGGEATAKLLSTSQVGASDADALAPPCRSAAFLFHGRTISHGCGVGTSSVLRPAQARNCVTRRWCSLSTSSFESPARMVALSVRAAWLLGDTVKPPTMKPSALFPAMRGVPTAPRKGQWADSQGTHD